MAKIEITLPAMGEGIIEATLSRILAPVGSEVEEEQSIVEVATDKVDSEVPTSESGIVEKYLYEEGDVVPVGATICIIKTANQEAEPQSETPQVFASQIENQISETVTQTAETSQNGSYLSPLVRSIIKKENISETELLQVKGSGKDGRITKDDLLTFLSKRSESIPQTENKTVPKPRIPAQEQITPLPSNITSGDTEIIEMGRMRRLIADHMVNSVQTSPHVTSFVEVDLTKIVKWRERVKNEFQQKYGEKLTYMPLFVEATCKALRDFPMVNISVDGYKIVKKNFVNIGMATALPDGNLIVPVLKNADGKNISGLARDINDMANRARNNKLKPDEIQGSTFSITNVGSFGNITGTPIINQPEVAILAIGVIRKKPAVIETPEGDTIGIRHQMIMSLSYDHRVVDGALGGIFLKRIADYLEGFDTQRTV